MMNSKRIGETTVAIYATRDEADSVAMSLASGELDGWTFEVTGIDEYRIRVHDAEGVFVDYWREAV